jgi:hypothetical protein
MRHQFTVAHVSFHPVTCSDYVYIRKVHFLVTNPIERFGTESFVSYSTAQKHKD